MVRGQQVTLNLEHILGVAQVAHEISGNVLLRFDTSRINLHPRRQNGIFFIPLEETHRSVVGINNRLDRITHVVDGVFLDVLPHRLRTRINRAGRQRLMLSVRIGIRCRVCVDNPNKALGRRGVAIRIDNSRVCLLFQCQVGSNLCNAKKRITIVENLRFLIRLRGEEDIG